MKRLAAERRARVVIARSVKYARSMGASAPYPLTKRPRIKSNLSPWHKHALKMAKHGAARRGVRSLKGPFTGRIDQLHPSGKTSYVRG